MNLLAATVIAVLNEMMRTVNAGDAAGYARLYAEDAAITIHGGGLLAGRAAIEAHEVELLREFPGTRLAFYDVWQSGPLAVVHYAVNGPPGKPMGHEGLLFYRFLPTGLIAEERRYNDSLTPMAQLGALGPVPARPLPVLPSAMTAHVVKGSPAETKHEALVRALIANLDRKDETAFLSSIADDAVVDEMIEPAPANAKAWFERWTRAVPDAKTEIATVIAAGDFVLMETVVRGTLKGPLGPLAVSDKPFTVHRAAIVQIKDGELVRLTAFMNGKELAQAVGQWPPAPRK
jgi:ketosteroid isomerase-like protein